MKVYAIIPARSGSKGVANKNISLVGGKPLLSHSILFAKKYLALIEFFVQQIVVLILKFQGNMAQRLPFCSLKCCNRYGYGGA